MSNYVAKLGSASAVLRTGPGRLTALKIRNRNAAARFAYLYDAAATPADGTTSPIDIFLLPATSQNIFEANYFSAIGLSFANGLAVVVSTADSGTQTTGTNSDHDITAVTY